MLAHSAPSADRDESTGLGLDPRLAEVELQIACDVIEPAPRPDRRGRDLRAAEGRDARPTSPSSTRGSSRYADALERRTGRRERDTPGAGAAGGVGFGLLAIAGPVPRRSRCVPGSTS